MCSRIFRGYQRRCSTNDDAVSYTGVSVHKLKRLYMHKDRSEHGSSNPGRLFQSVEYRTNNATVGGSSPSSTIFLHFLAAVQHTAARPASCATQLRSANRGWSCFCCLNDSNKLKPPARELCPDFRAVPRLADVRPPKVAELNYVFTQHT